MCGCIECWLVIVEQGWWLGKTQDLHRTSTSTLFARIVHCLQSSYDLGHVPGTQSARCNPKILVAMPVLVLGTADLCPHQRWTHSAVLVELDPLLQIPPRAVHDLGAALCFDLAACLRVFVNRHLHIRRCFPDPFALDFLPLFAMSDMVMENARHPQTIGLSSICVEDNTTVLEVLLCQRPPFNLSDSSWARGPFGGHVGLQPVEQ